MCCSKAFVGIFRYSSATYSLTWIALPAWGSIRCRRSSSQPALECWECSRPFPPSRLPSRYRPCRRRARPTHLNPINTPTNRHPLPSTPNLGSRWTSHRIHWSSSPRRALQTCLPTSNPNRWHKKSISRCRHSIKTYHLYESPGPQRSRMPAGNLPASRRPPSHSIRLVPRPPLVPPPHRRPKRPDGRIHPNFLHPRRRRFPPVLRRPSRRGGAEHCASSCSPLSSPTRTAHSEPVPSCRLFSSAPLPRRKWPWINLRHHPLDPRTSE